MGLSKDWREFLELLNSRGVDYVIVGAHSLALHGRPRYTGDLDILVRSTPENARCGDPNLGASQKAPIGVPGVGHVG